MENERTQPQVVIVGGGFAGLFAARALGEGPFSVKLIDETAQHVFQPLLYQCATGILSEGQITAPLRRLFRKRHNVECITSRAVDIDADRRILVCRRPRGDTFDLPYDYLIVGAGMEQSYFGHDEFAVWAPGMKTISNALTIRRRVFGAFEMAESAETAEDRQRWLTFALVGAGPTGVELAGQIRELATHTLRNEYRRARPEDAKVLLFDGGPAPLASFGKKLSGIAERELRALGVEMHMDSIVTNVGESGVTVRDKQGNETHHDVATVLWTAGVQAPPFGKALANATGAEHDRAGRIVVQDDLTIKGHPEITVAGDLMSLRKLPGVAEVAMQGGHYAGKRIRKELRGQRETKPFKYSDLGSAAYIARGRAVISMGPVQFGGFPGWVAWLFIHIAALTGYRNRFGAILSWWLPFTRDIRRERAFTVAEVGHVRDVYQPRSDFAVPVPAQPGQSAQAPSPRPSSDVPAKPRPKA